MEDKISIRVASRGVDQLAIEFIVKALVTSLVQTLTSPCAMLGHCAVHLEAIVVAVGPHVT